MRGGEEEARGGEEERASGHGPERRPSSFKERDQEGEEEEKAGGLGVVFIDDIWANTSVNSIQDGLKSSTGLLLCSPQHPSTLPCNTGLQDAGDPITTSYLHSKDSASASTNIEEADLDENDQGREKGG